METSNKKVNLNQSRSVIPLIIKELKRPIKYKDDKIIKRKKILFKICALLNTKSPNYHMISLICGM